MKASDINLLGCRVAESLKYARRYSISVSNVLLGMLNELQRKKGPRRARSKRTPMNYVGRGANKRSQSSPSINNFYFRIKLNRFK